MRHPSRWDQGGQPAGAVVLWACLIGLVVMLRPVTTLAQGGPAAAGGSSGGSKSPGAHRRHGDARAAEPPIIDGRDDDPVWRSASPSPGFVSYRPVEDAEPKFRDRWRRSPSTRDYLYVFVRAFDPHPDSIVGLWRGATR